MFATEAVPKSFRGRGRAVGRRLHLGPALQIDGRGPIGGDDPEAGKEMAWCTVTVSLP